MHAAQNVTIPLLEQRPPLERPQPKGTMRMWIFLLYSNFNNAIPQSTSLPDMIRQPKLYELPEGLCRGLAMPRGSSSIRVRAGKHG